MNAFLVLLVAAVLTYALRSSLVHALRGRELPARVTIGLSVVVPAGLAAVLVAATLAPHGSANVSARVVALAVAFVVARAARNATVTVGVGMVALWAVTALGA